MFGDDVFGGSIEELFRKLSGGDSFVEQSTIGPDGKRRTTRKTQSGAFGKALLDNISTKKKIYFIFDFSGKKDVYASVTDEIVEDNYGGTSATGKKILEVKEGNKVISEFPLSEKIRTKGFESWFNNGILEVSFSR
ncbi:MAG: hypothetical protein PF542_03225 [Nanoarchaeota archaeon]|jgi:hypothetical protein|nr:hypothetical protein [Nanoarchaeota archaeon]